MTATVLSAVLDNRAGAASGINNAVARTAQLLAVAVFPAVADLSGDDLTDPDTMAAGFPRALLAMAAVAALGAVLAWLTISSRPLAEIGEESGMLRCRAEGGRRDIAPWMGRPRGHG